MDVFEKRYVENMSDELKPSCVTLLMGQGDGVDKFAFTIAAWEIYKNKKIVILTDRTEDDYFKERLAETFSELAFAEYLADITNNEKKCLAERYIQQKKEIVSQKATIKIECCLESETLKSVCKKLAKNNPAKIIILDLNVFNRWQEVGFRLFRKNLAIIKEIAQTCQKHFLIIGHGCTLGSASLRLREMLTDNVQMLRLDFSVSLYDLQYVGGLHDGMMVTLACKHDLMHCYKE